MDLQEIVARLKTIHAPIYWNETGWLRRLRHLFARTPFALETYFSKNEAMCRCCRVTYPCLTIRLVERLEH